VDNILKYILKRFPSCLTAPLSVYYLFRHIFLHAYFMTDLWTVVRERK
jgi:hypothetical protein